MPRNLKRRSRNFLFPFPLKISVKTKKKKGLHVFRRPIYPPKSSEDQKNRSSRPKMSCFHCSAHWKYISAYISAREWGAADPAAPPWVRLCIRTKSFPELFPKRTLSASKHLEQWLKHLHRHGESGVRLPGRSNRTQCRQRFATAVVFLRAVLLGAEMNTATRYTHWSNTASEMKV